MEWSKKKTEIRQGTNYLATPLQVPEAPCLFIILDAARGQFPFGGWRSGTVQHLPQRLRQELARQAPEPSTVAAP